MDDKARWGAVVGVVAVGVVGALVASRSCRGGVTPPAPSSRDAGAAAVRDAGRPAVAGPACLRRRAALTGEGAPRLLFCSGFEGPVALGDREAPAGSTGVARRALTGGDVEGYAWPMRLGGEGGYLEMVEGTPARGVDGGVSLEAEIAEVEAHGGARGKALRMRVGAAGVDAGVGYVVPNARTEGSVYVRYWMKLTGEPLASQQWPIQAAPWRAVTRWEAPEDGGVERVALFVYGRGRRGDAGNIAYWHAQNEETAGNRTWWIVDSDGGVPWGRWFLLETGVRRDQSGAEGYWVAVDGRVVVSLPMGHRVFAASDTGTLVPFQLGGWPTPMEQEVDDVEVWSAPPCETVPCGVDEG